MLHDEDVEKPEWEDVDDERYRVYDSNDMNDICAMNDTQKL